MALLRPPLTSSRRLPRCGRGSAGWLLVAGLCAQQGWGRRRQAALPRSRDALPGSAGEPPPEFHVAPMVNVTHRHFRQLLRLITSRATLWTEMLKVGPKLLSAPEDRRELLDFHPAQRPVVLQLAGSEPEALGQAAALALPWAYDEVNLNCGCPSENGAYGAVLMRDPDRVAAITLAMSKAVGSRMRVSVKCRLAAHEPQDPARFRKEEAEYEALRGFVARVGHAGVRRFYVHARSALLGSSHAKNREVPPLRPALACRLAEEFPELEIVVNGGVHSPDAAAELCAQPLRGVMVARAVRDKPYLWSHLDSTWFRDAGAVVRSRRELLDAYLAYVQDFLAAEPIPPGKTARQRLRRELSLPLRNLFANEPGEGCWREEVTRWAHGQGPFTATGLRAAVQLALAGISPATVDARGIKPGDALTAHPLPSAPQLCHVHPRIRISLPDVSALEVLHEGCVVLCIVPQGLPPDVAHALLGRQPNCSVVRVTSEKAASRFARQLTGAAAAPLAIGSICVVASRSIAPGEPLVVARSSAAQAFGKLLECPSVTTSS